MNLQHLTGQIVHNQLSAAGLTGIPAREDTPALTLATADDLAAAATAVAAQGKDPAKDRHVQELAASYTLATIGLGERLVHATRTGWADRIRAQRDDLHAQLEEKFTAGAEQLAALAAELGNIDLPIAARNNVHTVSGHANAIRQALTVNGSLGPIVDAWRALWYTLDGASAPTRQLSLIIAAPDWEQWREGKLTDRPADPWTLLHLGAPLTLAADPAEVTERAAHIDRQRNAETAQEKELATYGPGGRDAAVRSFKPALDNIARNRAAAEARGDA